MGNNNIVLSLCIPTNGMTEWVIPLLESIYDQNCNEDLFEVIITNNGENKDFYKDIERFVLKHKNIIYKKTNSLLFQNQIDCFRLASGQLVKFLNHRDILEKGSINKIINTIENNKVDKPIIYFLNNQKRINRENEILDFDSFMYELSYYSTWSGGTTFWNDDIDLLLSKREYDKYFPHIDIVFAFENNRKYLIINDVLSHQKPIDETKKGRYDLFDAFANHFIEIIKSLCINNKITKNSYDKIKFDNLIFVIGLHYQYIVKKAPCSYILTNFWNEFLKQYNYIDFFYGYFCFFIRKIGSKINIIYEK